MSVHADSFKKDDSQKDNLKKNNSEKNNFRHKLEKKLKRHKQQNLFRRPYTVVSRSGSLFKIDSHLLINFCSNDYLGLSKHKAVIFALKEAADKFGVGSSASPLVCGRSHLHQQLEETLAEKTGREAALVFPSGYMANLAVATTFTERADGVFLDRLAHTSLIDAARLSAAKLHRYKHTDCDALGFALRSSPLKDKLVLTDAVFSMDGDKAPIEKLAKVCKQNDAVLAVDDAHGFGVLGKSGGGLLEEKNMQATDVPILVATFSKALGTAGAFIAADKIFIETLKQFAKTYIYTTALAPVIAGATITALKVLEHESWRRETLNTLIEYFCARVEVLGLHFLPSVTAIQPFMVGDSKKAVCISDKLFDAGFFVTAIRPPTVPEGSARLRITLTAEHTEAQIDRLLETLSRLS